MPTNNRLWVITTQFNPAGYVSLTNNYKRFVTHIRQSGVNLVVAELTYPNTVSGLTDPEVVQFKANHIMWHKERLLNLIIKDLPPECDCVAWIDADVIFTNYNWVEDTIKALERAPVVQMFEKVFLLDSQGNHHKDAYGFAFSFTNGFLDSPGNRYGQYWHGNMKHPGFAWAARRENIEQWGGLYDRHILGGGDFQMALAFVGDKSKDWYGRFGPTFQNHMIDWSDRVVENTKGAIGYTPGCILHMWHGHSDDRRYVERSKCLVDYEFDPENDITAGRDGLWEWCSDKPQLHDKVAEYFTTRHEDHNFPVFPNRYEDKYPIIVNASNAEQLHDILTRLSAQLRRDFVVWVTFADYKQGDKLKQVCRNEYWSFEIRTKQSYLKSQRLVPRRFQMVKEIGPTSRANKILFADGLTNITPDWVSHCVHNQNRVVIDKSGQLQCADTAIVKSRWIQATDSKHGSEERLVAIAKLKSIPIGVID